MLRMENLRCPFFFNRSGLARLFLELLFSVFLSNSDWIVWSIRTCLLLKLIFILMTGKFSTHRHFFWWNGHGYVELFSQPESSLHNHSIRSVTISDWRVGRWVVAVEPIQDRCFCLVVHRKYDQILASHMMQKFRYALSLGSLFWIVLDFFAHIPTKELV